jgi:hypothetical protein
MAKAKKSKSSTSRTAKAKKTTATKSSKKDVGAFVDHIHRDRGMRAILKKGWDEVVREGKRRGYDFTKQELHNHLKKRYKVSATKEQDEPDTCICI